MNKKIRILLLLSTAVCFLFLGTTQQASAATNPFKDVKASYYYDAVIDLNSKKIVTGKSKTVFGVGDKATRAQTAQYIANALNLDTKNVKNPGFTDVPKTHANYGAIAALANKGIINGVGNKKFAPNGTLERYQIAKILTLAFELDIKKTSSSKFKDISILDKTLQSYIHTLVDYGIAKGTSTTTFAPKTHVNKQDLAVFIYRTIDATEALTIVDIQ